MIERSGGRQTLACDSCDDPLDEDFEPDRFQAMLDHAKEERWTIRLEDGSWRHYCPDCGAPTGGKLETQRKLFGL